MKRILSVALLLTVGLGIVGCGDEGASTPAPSTTTTEPAKPADAAPGAPAETP
jgi:hypothetical protein